MSYLLKPSPLISLFSAHIVSTPHSFILALLSFVPLVKSPQVAGKLLDIGPYPKLLPCSLQYPGKPMWHTLNNKAFWPWSGIYPHKNCIDDFLETKVFIILWKERILVYSQYSWLLSHAHIYPYKLSQVVKKNRWKLEVRKVIHQP